MTTTPRKVLVTGASGFIGSELVHQLLVNGFSVKAVVRTGQAVPEGALAVHLSDLRDASQDFWQVQLADVDVVVHAAAIAENPQMDSAAAEKLYESVNVTPTQVLASAAASAGVRRFVFMSSIKVLGEATLPGHPFGQSNDPAPKDSYGRSKLRAEQEVLDVARHSTMEAVIVRPPVCFGPGVKGNFSTLRRIADSPMPLPLGAIDNHRSLVSLANLCDFVLHCVTHPAAAGETLLVSDGEDISTTSLLRKMRRILERPPRLLPVPSKVLYAVGVASGQASTVRRLCESLQVDIQYSRDVLGWTPPVSLDDGISMWLAKRPE